MSWLSHQEAVAACRLHTFIENWGYCLAVLWQRNQVYLTRRGDRATHDLFLTLTKCFFCFFFAQTLSAVLSEHCAVSVKHFEEFALEILWKRQHLIIWASSNSQDVNVRNVAAVCCVHYSHCISSSAPDSMQHGWCRLTCKNNYNLPCRKIIPGDLSPFCLLVYLHLAPAYFRNHVTFRQFQKFGWIFLAILWKHGYCKLLYLFTVTCSVAVQYRDKH